jgi:hypothetical protein
MQILLLIALNSHYVKTCNISNIHAAWVSCCTYYMEIHMKNLVTYFMKLYIQKSCYGLLNIELHT